VRLRPLTGMGEKWLMASPLRGTADISSLQRPRNTAPRKMGRPAAGSGPSALVTVVRGSFRASFYPLSCPAMSARQSDRNSVVEQPLTASAVMNSAMPPKPSARIFEQVNAAVTVM